MEVSKHLVRIINEYDQKLRIQQLQNDCNEIKGKIKNLETEYQIKNNEIMMYNIKIKKHTLRLRSKLTSKPKRVYILEYASAYNYNNDHSNKYYDKKYLFEGNIPIMWQDTSPTTNIIIICGGAYYGGSVSYDNNQTTTGINQVFIDKFIENTLNLATMQANELTTNDYDCCIKFVRAGKYE
jgi:hypothetical protein